MFDNDDIEETSEHYALHIEPKNAETRIWFSCANKAEVASGEWCVRRVTSKRV